MNLLERVEENLKNFRPKTPRQFAAFNVAFRFEDLPHLARYLNACHHSARTLFETARVAETQSLRGGSDRIAAFFDLLAERDRKEAA